MSLLPFLKKQKKKDINLLPEEAAQAALEKKNILVLLLIPLSVLAVLVGLFIVLFIFETAASSKQADINKKIEQKEQEWQQFSDLATSISKIKTNLGEYQTGVDQNNQIISSITSTKNLVPGPVSLTGLTVKESGEVSVTGLSSDPRAIYQFLEILKKESSKFSDVSLGNIGFAEVDNEVVKKAYSFEISFIYKGND